MITNLTRIAIVCAMAIPLASCSSQSDDKPNTITFTSSEVAKLLGIKEGDGIKFGEITSNRDGVKVASIEMSDGSGKEFEADDLDLGIASTEKFVYEVSHLRIGKIDIHDWKNGQRARVFDLAVVSPGKHFIAAIDDAITSVKTGGVLKTSRLSFARLAIGQIEYLVNETKSVTKVSLEKLFLDDANEKSLGKFSIDRITIGELVGVENLKFTQVDRAWVDKLLTLLLKASQSGLKGSDWSPIAGRSGVVVPFDQFAVDRIVLHLDSRLSPSRKAMSITVSDLQFDINRTRTGEFAGLSGFVKISAPSDEATSSPADKDIRKLVHALLKNTTDPLEASVQLSVTFDPTTEIEQFDKVVLDVPSFGTVSGSIRTQGLTPLLGMCLLYGKDTSPPDIKISELHLKYQDAGLAAYLLSSRFPDSKSINEGLTRIAEKFPITGDRERLKREVEEFRKAPRIVEVDFAADEFMPVKKFGEEIGRTSSTAVRSNLKFTGR